MKSKAADRVNIVDRAREFVASSRVPPLRLRALVNQFKALQAGSSHRKCFSGHK